MAVSAQGPAMLWRRLGLALGCLVLALTGGTFVAGQAMSAEISGPLNVLLVGIDPRGTHIRPFADTIIVAHVPADRSRVYLFSIPRDLVVRIPAFPASGTPAQRGKINSAMALGSQLGNGAYRPAQGFPLLAEAVGGVTGIKNFDAGVIINFGGLQKLVEAVGGVKMVIDQDVVSEHKKPDGSPRDRLPQCQGADAGCLRPYTGVQKIYRKSDQPVRLRGWEALDYLRQRYGLPRVDYDRQRHQRQFLTALAKQLNPARLVKAVQATGDAVIVTGSRPGIAAWAGEMRALKSVGITTVGLPGEALFEDGRYLGEQFTEDRVGAFFRAVAADRVASFLVSHPGLVER